MTQIVEAAGDRIKVAGDILDYDDFFVADDKFAYDEKAFEKRITKPAGAVDLLAKFRAALAGVEPFTAAALGTLAARVGRDAGNQDSATSSTRSASP